MKRNFIIEHIRVNKKPSEVLYEGSLPVVVTEKEKVLKRKLIALLQDDGEGHHHAAYAKRLEKFVVQILPWLPPRLRTPGRGYIEVAAVVYDKGLIFVNEGVLTNPANFKQLSLLLRHELAHSIFLHNLRAAKKIEGFAELLSNESVADLINIIMDADISNRVYSADDKKQARTIQLNAPKSVIDAGLLRDMREATELVCGIVTEDMRAKWATLTLEEMIDKLQEEITRRISVIRGRMQEWELSTEERDKKDNIQNSIIAAYNCYSNITSGSSIKVPIDDFIKSGCKMPVRTRHGTRMAAIAEPYKKVAEAVYNGLHGMSEISDEYIQTLLEQIADSGILSIITLSINGTNVKLTSPEEKYIASEVLKKFRSEYKEWYDKVYNWANTRGRWKIKKILTALGLKKGE